ncbi:phage major capsid protein [Thermodesulfobacteriota bacterium]
MTQRTESQFSSQEDKEKVNQFYMKKYGRDMYRISEIFGELKVTTKWQLRELSVVPIGADQRAKSRGATDIKILNDNELKGHVKMENENQNINIREIIAIGEQHNFNNEAREFIKNGKSVEDFRQFVLSKLRAKSLIPIEDMDPEIGLSHNERQQFSFMRAIRSLVSPGDTALRDAAGFEFECSRAVSDKTRRNPKGLFIPTDVLRHDYTQDMNTYTGAQGGYLVDNVLAAGSFIESLENAMVVKELGAIMLRDLIGDLAIPKKTGGATAYWIGEGDNITESQPALGQVALRPKTVGGYTDIIRKMLVQSSIDIETFVRSDLALRLAFHHTHKFYRRYLDVSVSAWGIVFPF